MELSVESVSNVSQSRMETSLVNGSSSGEEVLR